MSYRDRTRKTVTLPSGAVAIVTRLAPVHLIELGDIPLADFGEDPKRKGERTAKSIAANIKFQNVVLKNCVLSFEFAGEKFKLVDKHPNDCPEGSGELSIHELEPSDVEAIQRAFGSFEEGRLAREAKPFPEIQKPSGEVASNGESLRHPANGIPAPALA